MRLIDADALKEKQTDVGETGEFLVVSVYDIDDAPTIGLSEKAKRDIATILENELDMRVIADRKHGKWELVGSTTMGDPFGELAWGGMYRCSECGYVRHFITEHFKFCPNCGAQLEIK